MFETVSPDAFVKRQRLIFYESLPMSIAIHAIAAGAVVAVAIAHTNFPTEPPRLIAAYSLAQPPPPPPPPPSRTNVPQVVKHQVIPPQKELAPTVVPDAIPVVQPVTTLAAVEPQKEPDSGVVGGVEGGLSGGVIGGDPI